MFSGPFFFFKEEEGIGLRFFLAKKVEALFLEL
jgi:hypothetical protein